MKTAVVVVMAASSVLTPYFTTMAASALVAAAVFAQAPDRHETAFHAAMKKETVDGDLKSAIEGYKKLAQVRDRTMAAKALVRMGECFERLGDAEAQRAYQRVLRDFSDQKDAVEAARARLAALGVGAGPGQLTRAVWTGPKAESWGSSLSPDGRYLSFPDWDSGNLALHDLATGTDKLLTNTGTYKRGETAYAESSAISRDGKQITYAWYDDQYLRYELRVLSLNGETKPRRLFENRELYYIEPRDWSPDGKWIVVCRSDRQSAEVGLVDAQSGSFRVLKTGKNMTPGPISADGKYMVYTTGTQNNSRSFILSLETNAEVPLLPLRTSSSASPVWTPDGTRIVFVSDRSGSPGLWCIRVVDGKPVGEPERLKTDFGYAYLKGFTRDGSLVFGTSLHDSDIYVARLDPATGKITSEPERVIQRFGNSWGRIAWLPDGKALSFWNRKPLSALVMHTLSTGEEREIWGGKSGRKGGGYAGWFADGGTLMGISEDGDQMRFRRVDSATGEVQGTWSVRRYPPDTRPPAFSPDLMTMYFSQKDRTCERNCTWTLIAREIVTGRDREVLRMNEGFWPVAVSHDGRELAIFAWGGAARRLMTVPAAGGPARELYRTNDNGSGFYPTGITWTSDGRHVIMLRRLAGAGELWSFPAQGGPPQISPLRVRPSETPAVSPDGTHIAFVTGSNKSEIWIMTGVFGTPKAAASR